LPVAQRIRDLVTALKEAHVTEGEAPSPTAANGSAARPEPRPLFISRPKPSPEELDRLLDELSSAPPGKVLPADFSRADIYDDHD
jgi:hypothetical protein